MRILLFFDLPTLTSSDLRRYRYFRKNLICNGFYMIQESVYVKMALNQQIVDSTISKVKSCLPSNGNVIVLVITEKQFASLKILLGDIKTEVVTTDERVVIL